MDKVLAPIDEFIAGIGKFIMVKPRFAALMFLIVLALFIITGTLTFRSSSGTDNTILNMALPAQTPAPSSPAPIIPATTSVITQAATSILATTHGTISNSAPISTQNSQQLTIKSGDTLAGLFQQLGLSANDLVAINKAAQGTRIFKTLRPGQTLDFYWGPNRELLQLVYTGNNNKIISFTRTGKSFEKANGKVALPSGEITLAPLPTTSTLTQIIPQATTASAASSLSFVNGEVKGSLYRSLERAGLPNKYVMQVVNIFNQDINLVRSIRKGDQFTVLYQKGSQEGSKLVNGAVLAAALITKNGKKYQLVRYTDPEGQSAYYTPEGVSLNPPLDRTPVHYTYISSYFSSHRWQPILHFYRPHYGVDYAAPSGTPIKAAGNGHIVFIGRKGGYGNAIIIKHDATYTTVYGHLSRFAANVRDHTYVTKGQVIGYVGETGLATGPHLHFEIHVNNIPENPLTVALPTGTPLPWEYRKEFFAETKPLLAQLNLHQPIQLATKSTNSIVENS